MKALITVIVPVYNVCEYLDKCLNSIISQTYENLEILVIDDGSTDGSEIICDHYKKIDSRVRVIHKKNEGIGKTRNLGIREAKGEYIGFVDSDDYIDTDMYEILYNVLLDNDADLSICDYVEFGDSVPRLNVGSGKIYSFDKIEALKELLKDNIITNHSVNKLFKRELFKGVLCPLNRKYEDVSYIYKTIINCKKVVYIDKVLYAYYQRDGSTVHTFDKKNVVDFYRAYDERNKYLLKRVPELGDWLISDKIFSILLLNLLISKSGNSELYDLRVVRKSYLEYKRVFNLKYMMSIKNFKRLFAVILYIDRRLFYFIITKLYKIRRGN